MNLHTTSEVISFARQLEGNAARFYEDLARIFAAEADTFLSFAKENGKNVTQVERAYYGVITDAIEGCYAFDIEPDKYAIDTVAGEDLHHEVALNRATEIEEKIIQFYTDAAEQSRPLMADIPQAFSLIARKKKQRLEKIQTMSD